MRNYFVFALLIFYCLLGCQSIPHKHVRKTDTKVIIGEYENQSSEASHCYSDYLKNNPGLQAKIVLRWTIDRNGKPFDTLVTKDTLFQPSISKCLLGHLKSMHFTPTPLFHKATIEYTYNLKSNPVIIE